MSSSNDTDLGLPGAEAGESLDDLLQIWNPAAQTLVCAFIATMLLSMIFVSVLYQVFEYYSTFHKTDRWWTQVYVGFGTTLGLAMLITNIVMVCELSYNFGQYSKMVVTEFVVVLTDMAEILLFSIPTAAFFSWRAWRLSNRQNWLLPIFFLAIAGIFGSSLAVLIKGFEIVDPRDDLEGFFAWGFMMDIYWPKWAICSLVCDAVVCLFSIYYLLRTKSSVFHSQKHLWNRLVSLIFESMLPPLICLIVLVISKSMDTAITGDFRRIFTTNIGLLYFHSLMHSLVSRKTVRKLLDENRKSMGFNTGNTSGNNPGFSGPSLISYGSGSKDPLGDVGPQTPTGTHILEDVDNNKRLSAKSQKGDQGGDWIMLRMKPDVEGLVEEEDQVHLSRHPWAAPAGGSAV